jgi:hypothetical protein
VGQVENPQADLVEQTAVIKLNSHTLLRGGAEQSIAAEGQHSCCLVKNNSSDNPAKTGRFNSPPNYN